MAHKIQVSVDVLLFSITYFLKVTDFGFSFCIVRLIRVKTSKKESDISRSKIGGLVEYGS